MREAIGEPSFHAIKGQESLTGVYLDCFTKEVKVGCQRCGIIEPSLWGLWYVTAEVNAHEQSQGNATLMNHSSQRQLYHVHLS